MEFPSVPAQPSNSTAVNPGLAWELIESFNWAETAEGHAYWEALYWQLLGLAAHEPAQ